MITAFVRTVLLYFILILGLRLMGKRQIGELEPTELVLTMLLSDLAAVPMQDFGIPLLSGVIPIVTLLALSMLLSFLCMRSLRLRRLVCGREAVLVREGVLQQWEMRRNRFTVDELIEELRAQGVTDLAAVKYAVLETNGQLSVLLYPAEQPATPKNLGLHVPDDVTLPTVLINDGRVLHGALRECGLNEQWLTRQLHARGFASAREVLLLSVDGQGRVLCIRREGRT